MNEIDVNAHLLDALKKRWRLADGTPNIGGYLPEQFDTSKVQLRVVNINYVDLQKFLVKKPIVLREETIANSSGATITHTFSFSKQTTDSFQWNIKAGLKLQAGAKAKAGLPIVGEAEVSTSVTLSFEGGYVNTHSQTNNWNDSVQIQVPAHTSVQTQALLSTGDVSKVPFKACLHAVGLVGCLYQRDSRPAVWHWADLDTGTGWVDPNFQKLKKLPLDPADREFIVDGEFSGSVGFNVIITSSPVTA